MVPAGENKCSNCPTGYYGTKEFTLCGIILAIVFFPFGLICLWCLRDTKCSACGHKR